MKNTILTHLKTDRSFEKGREIYMKSGKSLSFKKQLNMQGDTALIRGILNEELRKMGGISPDEFKAIISKPVVVEKKAKAVKKEETAPPPAPKSLKEIPEMVKKAIKLRTEFPFLGLSECPNELKILVADMITAYEKYTASYPKLFEEMTEEQAFEATADVVENYIENRSIWVELNHYKETGILLGEHPIFAEEAYFKELREEDNGSLIKRNTALYNAITRTKKVIADGNKPDLTQQRLESIASKEREQKEVQKLLKERGIELK